MRKRPAPPRKKSGMPWWGWLIAAFLLLKGCQQTDAFIQEHSLGAPPAVEVTL